MAGKAQRRKEIGISLVADTEGRLLYEGIVMPRLDDDHGPFLADEEAPINPARIPDLPAGKRVAVRFDLEQWNKIGVEYIGLDGKESGESNDNPLD